MKDLIADIKKQHEKPKVKKYHRQAKSKNGRDRVYVYFTPAQKERLMKKAAANDLTLSGLIVGVIERTIDKQTVLEFEWEDGDFE